MFRTENFPGITLASSPMLRRRVLHVGCGMRGIGVLPTDLSGPAFEEVRLDINPIVEPDIVASLTDMSVVATGSFDVLYSSNNLEHLFSHEVPIALREFRRVLNGAGIAIITVPDLKAIAEKIIEDRLEDAAYESPAGPITPLDMLYGFGQAIGAGNLFMAHRTGFTAKRLGTALMKAGFAHVKVGTRNGYDLWAFAYCLSPSA